MANRASQGPSGDVTPPIPLVQGLMRWSLWLTWAVVLLAGLALLSDNLSQDISGRRALSDLSSTWRYLLYGGAMAAAVAALVIRYLARRIERQVVLMGSIDALTGLPNRTALLSRLEADSIAVLYIDLDRFKMINDNLGHDTGDAVLKTVAQRIRRAIRETDLVVRLGGDEFVVLVEGEHPEVLAVQAGQRLLAALRPVMVAEGRELYITGSVGIAVKCEALQRPTDLLRAADLALYRAKRQGRDRIVVFNETMEANNVLAQLDLESDLWRAVERDELEVHYQPEINIGTGQITGFEALVRWRHPVRGLLKPDSFIGLAEENGALREIGLWVLEQACKQWRRWREIFDKEAPVVVSVNLSLRQLEEPDLVERVRDILAEHGMEPSSLKLEITESALLAEMPAVVSQLARLRAMGIRLAIDDFGTGYSSLTYLKNLPVHSVKIDQSFVRNMEDDDASLLIVQAIVTLAHDLGLDVTAEGVETRKQLDHLERLGCDRGQGFYLSEPLPAETIEALLKAYGRREARQRGKAA
ncbi:MAG TPA: bifunctional diguanylate cyclase/phosphodiesterase [Dehalococcoidia bacterium]|nr:bifunctional diguanylate cyclase/phosphodiesterase [Dehalococcoidia bacterium]